VRDGVFIVTWGDVKQFAIHGRADFAVFHYDFAGPEHIPRHLEHLLNVIIPAVEHETTGGKSREAEFSDEARDPPPEEVGPDGDKAYEDVYDD
jgi:hypothetical protein